MLHYRISIPEMMKIVGLIFSVSVFFLCGCAGKGDGAYFGIGHYGTKSVVYTSVKVDTLRFGAQHTSLEGQWLMRDSILYFIDRYVVGVKAYSLEGEYLGEHIKQGRGPDEVLCASWVSAIDEPGGNFVFHDTNCAVQVFTPDTFRKLVDSEAAWFMKLGEGFGEGSWQDLLHNPDPEIPQMYEYRFDCGRMLSADGQVILPVTTEHVSYNGYNVSSGAKDYWRHSYIFITFDPDDIAGTKHLFGHYPPVYHRKNIPAFSEYDFCFLDSGRLLVGFAADPLIYIMDTDGNIVGSLGFRDAYIKGDYPQTRTFDAYERNCRKIRTGNGYYGRMSHCGGLVFRTCRRDDGTWMLQVYDDRTFDMVGDISLGDRDIEIVGEYGGHYWAYCDVDLAAEEFVMLRFSLDNIK